MPPRRAKSKNRAWLLWQDLPSSCDRWCWCCTGIWLLVVFFFFDLNLKNIKNNNIPLKHWGRRAPAQPTAVTQPEAVWIASRTFEDRDMPPNRGFMVFIYPGFRRSNHYLLTNCEMSEELLLPARAHIPLLQPYHWRAAAILGCDSHQSLTTGADN